MATRFAAFLCCLAAAWCGLAQAPVAPIRLKMKDSLVHTPDFVCAESMERNERAGAAQPTVFPAIHASAGIIAGKEMYEWPSTDAERVALREALAQLDRAGTGSFAVFSQAVFLTTGATYYDGPEEMKDGRKLLRLDFAMPREGSSYALPKANGPAPLGYSGSIWVDPGTLEVANLALQADGLPADAGIKSMTQSFQYAGITLGGARVLLPTAMDFALQEPAGKQVRIAAHFTDCHAYVPRTGDRFLESGSESSVTIAVSSASRTGGAHPPKPEEQPLDSLLPPKTRIDTILAESIDERTMKDGDKLSLTVLRDIKVRGKVVVPRGSAASAHVTRILILNYAWITSVRRYYLVGMQFDGVEVGGRQYHLRANLDRVGPPADSIGFLPYSNDPNNWGKYDLDRTLLLCPKPEPGESFLGIVREYLRLGSHVRLYWSVE